MPYHVLIYSMNTFGVTNYDMIPTPDDIIATQNGHYLPHLQLSQFGGWLSGTLLTAIRLVTPRSRQVVPPPMYPINGTTLPPDRPHMFDRRSNPFTLNAVEEVSFQANAGGAANALATAVVFWGTSIDPVPAGDIYSLHGTSTAAAGSQTWTTVPITWDQTIPAGMYAMIGSQHVSTNAIAHRWVFKDQILRPGFISQTSLTNMTDPAVYYGGWGKFGQFNTYTYPALQVWCNGTDASHDVVMNIVRMS